MKRIIAMILAVTMLLVVTACGNSNSGNDDIPNDQAEAQQSAETNGDGKTLVVYFSVTDNTETDATTSASITNLGGEEKGTINFVADWIAEATGADQFSIKTEVIYSQDYDDVVDQADDEQDDNIRPALTASIDNFDEYDTVFIGYPIWWYDMPQAMFSFFDEYDFSGKTIIPFCTHEGSAFTGTIDTIKELEPNATVIEDGLALRGGNVEDSEEDVKAWVSGLGL